MDLKQIEWKDINWIYLAQAKDKWWAVVNMVRNLQLPHNTGYFLTSRELLASQERLYSMVLVSLYFYSICILHTEILHSF